jgi:eukaryotic translation initiation factor 2C
VANSLGVAFEPKLTFITLLKSHNTRFFPLEKDAKNAQGKPVAVQAQDNILPGSIVEKGVTSRSLYDFFLQSQQALQGTAIPGHYYVLYDENHWKPDELQKVTYNLCSVFGRATKSVRVVPPAYYADLLCERATCFVHDVQVKKGQSPVDAAKKALGAGIHKNVTGRMIYI